MANQRVSFQLFSFTPLWWPWYTGKKSMRAATALFFWIVLSFFFILPSVEIRAEINPLRAAVFTFTRDLRLGDRGDDVRELQRLLNEDPQTVVAVAGVGSRGEETLYFGFLTRAAVVRFQEKYRAEILEPFGLKFGTGFVGSLTRKKLNSITPGVSLGDGVLETGISGINIYEGDQKLRAIQEQVAAEMERFKRDGTANIDPERLFSDIKVMIFALSPNAGKAGSEVTIFGTGFENARNTLHFGERAALKNLRSLSGDTLRFFVPLLPSGRYIIAVSNKAGVSNTSFFVLNTATSVPVTIERITPAEVNFGEEVTVFGSGFTVSGNEVRTSVGVWSNLNSPDGKSIIFKANPESLREAAATAGVPSFTLEVSVVVVNDNGISAEPKFLKLTR